MKALYAFSLALLLSLGAFAQPPESLWSRTFGGGSDDGCYAVQQTADEGYVLAGYTYSFGAGGGDFWLVKTDGNGSQQWTRTFGGGNWDVCRAVQQTTDEGYVLAGHARSFGAGPCDFWLVKTDGSGNQQWGRTFGGSYSDRCYAAEQTSDGGYVLAGRTYSFGAGSGDFWLVKASANGDSLWSRTFGGGNSDECNAVQQASDGGYVLAGWTWSFGAGNADFYLVKTDGNGNQQWSRTFGGGNSDECYGVQQTADGGYVLAGWTNSFGAGSGDFWLVKASANGDSLWSRTFGGGNDDRCYAVQQTTDGGYVLAGVTRSFGAGGDDFYVVKTDGNGNQQWSRTFGGGSSDLCLAIRQTTDGGYVLAGYTSSFGAGNSDFYLVKTGPDFIPAVNDLVIQADSPNVLLFWTPVSAANVYDIYFSHEPSDSLSHYQLGGSTTDSLFVHAGGAVDSLRFYVVVGRR